MIQPMMISEKPIVIKIRKSGKMTRLILRICKEHMFLKFQRYDSYKNGNEFCPECRKTQKIPRKYIYGNYEEISYNGELSENIKSYYGDKFISFGKSSFVVSPKIDNLVAVFKTKRANNKYNLHLILKCPIHNVLYHQRVDKHRNGVNGCKLCGLDDSRLKSVDFYNDAFSEKQKEFTMLEVLDTDGTKRAKFQCNKCGHIFDRVTTDIYSITCPKCNHKTGSEFQRELVKYIESIYDGKIEINKKMGKYEIDIFLPELNIGIECNGDYWHSTKFKSRNYHKNKSFYFLEKDINVIHIWGYQWLNKPDIIKSMISYRLGLIQDRIYARKCKITTGNNDFFKYNHIHGNGSKGGITYNLIYDEEIVSSLKMSKVGNVWEIDRFASKLNTVVVGGFSKLFKRFLLDNPGVKTIISYSYIDFNPDYTSSVYYKNGFELNSVTQPSLFYTKNGSYYSRQMLQKHKLKELFPDKYNGDKTANEILSDLRFNVCYNSGNFKFKKEIK